MSEEVASEQGLEVRVKAVAKALSQDEEVAAKLRLWGFSVAEIAESMGRDEATVRRCLARVQSLLAADAQASERQAAARGPVKVEEDPPRVAARWVLPPEWEARLASVAGRGAVRRVRGVVSGNELIVIVLRLEGLRECDIARQLGVRTGTVNTRLVRARKRLAVEAPELARQLWTRGRR